MPAEPQPDDDTAGLADGLRELSDVWRVGLDGAQVMAERVLDLYTNLPATARMTPGDPDTELRRVRIDLERAVDLSVDVFDRVLTHRGATRPVGHARRPAAPRTRSSTSKSSRGTRPRPSCGCTTSGSRPDRRPISVAARSRASTATRSPRHTYASTAPHCRSRRRTAAAVEVSVEVPVGNAGRHLPRSDPLGRRPRHLDARSVSG